MLHINLNKIAGNHVEQSSFTDNLNQYQLRSPADKKLPKLILRQQQNHTVVIQRLSSGRNKNSGDRCVKISHHLCKQHLPLSLTTIAQLH
ncbi:hypothetical protein IQ259_21795 [Fortiea sp. LEGE XX443]|uniref:hypothetical protein n=1 Tax=Fortiea sp. LEGE XX443 TaxID=1828611 RepID=UPI0018815947|nr:hypothetical protein [Fortiea sp. LEGE XX443]MBE9007623.1 hypothetical protein [Fortiea sp. LEGE XX443]